MVEFQPAFVNGERKQAILTHLRALSQPLNNGESIIRDSGLILGSWSTFFDDWLLETASSSYWKSVEVLHLAETLVDGGPSISPTVGNPSKL